MRRHLFISVVFLLFASSTFAQSRDIAIEGMRSEKRVALVVGNSAYPTSPLRNPVNDARAMARTLRGLGFAVLLHENAGEKDLKRAIEDFGDRLRGGGVGVFFFAGHGLQVAGRNYLAPVDANIRNERDVDIEAIDVNRVLARMEEARNRLNIVILDACRDNPFGRSFRSTARGLASIDAPSGTLIAYATAPGKVARDGDGANGIYTGELLKALRESGLRVEDMFKRVRAAVRRQTNGDQIPWESSSLEGDFVFNLAKPDAKVASLPPEPPAAPPPRPAIGKEIKIGFGMALTGGLAPNGKAALIAMQIWAEDVNKKGGILGRKVELVYYDDQTRGAMVPGIYTKLLDVDKVDFVVSGYGTNLIAPAMPIVMERKLVFPGLFGLANNEKHNYQGYFQIMPAGPRPAVDWTNGFFEIASKQTPKPQTVALVGADAEYPHNALGGARENIKKYGFKIVYDKTYPPTTVDYTPIVRAIKAVNPDVVFVASYPPDSVGMVLAAHEVGLHPKLFGGGMVGLQFAALMTKLGPKLNGIVNYDFWVPEPTLRFPGIEEFLNKYQAQAAKQGVDPLGYYLPPWAYAYLEVLGKAIEDTKSLDQRKIIEYIRANEFDTIVGKVKFGPNGEWAMSRVLQIQFQNVTGTDLEQFKRAGKRPVLYPEQFRSGNLIYPYVKANP